MNEKEIRIDYFRGSGPGGQHRNTSETGVRITHLPTGLVATATESRSRHMNLKRAMARLEDKLVTHSTEKRPRIATRPTKTSSVKRLDVKRRAGEKKLLRRKITSDD